MGYNAGKPIETVVYCLNQSYQPRLKFYFNTNKPQWLNSLQNTSCIWKPQVILVEGGRGGGEVHPPTSSPEYWPVFKTRAQAWVRIVRKRVSNLKVKVFGQSRLRLFVEGIITANPLLISPPHSNKPPLFRVGKLISPPSLLSPPLPFPLPSIFILHKKITINVDWSVMVYSGWKFVLFLVFGRMTSNFICLTLSTLRSSSLWRIVPIFLSLDIP